MDNERSEDAPNTRACVEMERFGGSAAPSAGAGRTTGCHAHGTHARALVQRKRERRRCSAGASARPRQNAAPPSTPRDQHPRGACAARRLFTHHGSCSPRWPSGEWPPPPGAPPSTRRATATARAQRRTRALPTGRPPPAAPWRPCAATTRGGGRDAALWTRREGTRGAERRPWLTRARGYVRGATFAPADGPQEFSRCSARAARGARRRQPATEVA